MFRGGGMRPHSYNYKVSREQGQKQTEGAPAEKNPAAAARKQKQNRPRKHKLRPQQWAPPFAALQGEPLWKHFWAILAAGAALRLLAAITGDWLLRTDELFQYLEQAHRIVFGYGQIPWEYRFGERTWLLPSLSAPPLFLAKIAGWDSPETYAPMVRSFHALLSLSLPAGMYFFARRIHSETAARAALVFGCFWHELVIVSPHPIAENSAATFFFVAVLLASPAPGGIGRRALIGFLLGAVVVFRNPYLPPAALLGVLMLLPPGNAARAAMIAAGLFALFFAGAVDYFAWGSFAETYINYYNLQTSGYQQYTLNAPPLIHLKYMLTASAGLFFLAFAASLFYIRRLWLPAAFFLLVQVPHNLLVSGEYTNTFLGVPFVLVLSACLVAEWINKRAAKKKRGEELEIIPPQKKAAFFSAMLFIASAAAFFGALPNQKTLYVFQNERPLFYENQFFKANIALHNQPQETVKSAVFLLPGGSAHLFGGYYYTHRNIPLWFPFTDNHDRDALGLKEKTPQEIFAAAGQIFATSASHLIVPRGLQAEGFTTVAETPQFAVLANNNIAAVTPPPGAVYDIMDNGIVGVLQILDTRLKIISQKESPLTPHAP